MTTGPTQHTHHTPTPTVHAAAPPSGFLAAPLEHFQRLHPATLDTRRELGLPTDRPVVLTGHQPLFFHPGILAKYLAAAHLNERLTPAGADPWTGAAVVIDHDQTDPFTIAAPAPDARGLPAAVTAELAEPLPPGVASLAARARKSHEKPRITPEKPRVSPETERALTNAARTIDAFATEPSAAVQAAHANAALLGAHHRARLFTATDLARTAAFAAAARHLASHPESLHAYNNAGRAHPEAGIPALDLSDQSDPEIPLWRLDDKGRRRRAHASDVEPALKDGSLRPRALLLTALLRALACDLFIHGTGGGLYDRVTDRWLAHAPPFPEPLAHAATDAAPAAVVTADVFLPSEPAETPDAAEVSRLRWRAHHARHHPGEIGDAVAQTERDRLAGRIRGVRSRAERLARYRELHAFLESYRRERAPAIDRLDTEADHAARLLAWREANAGRAWPAFLYPPATLDGLDTAVRRAVLGEPGG